MEVGACRLVGEGGKAGSMRNRAEVELNIEVGGMRVRTGQELKLRTEE